MKHFILFSLISFGLIACQQGGLLSGPTLGGKAGELLIVINDEYKNTDVNVQISSIMGQYEVGLTQSEAPFNLLTISRNHFSSVFRPHRNILFLDVDKKHKKARMQFHKDMWTRNQAYIGIEAPNKDSLISFLKKKHSVIIDYFIQAEIDRYTQVFRQIKNSAASKTFKDVLNIDIAIPNGFNINKKEDGFVWASKESDKHSQGIIVYSRPYTDVNQLEKWQLLEYRDSILQKHIPGPSKGSFMTTEYVLGIHEKVGRYINNDYTMELRGKWRVMNDFMAGPFVSYSFVDTSRNQLITAEGYVYYPNKNKRNFMRELQAICRSTRIYSTKNDKN